MSGPAHAPDRLDRAVEVLKRSTEALFYCTLIFVLASLVFLVGAGVFGILHPGNDFGGSPGGSGGDVIVPTVLR